ncbi:MAG: sulfotransferase [Chloroflexota bacterium]
MKFLNTNEMSLGTASLLYNVRRMTRMLMPKQRFPLHDTANVMQHPPILFVSAGRSGTTLLRSMLVAGGQIAIPPQSYVLCYATLQFQAMQEQSWENLSRLVISLFEAHSEFERWDFDMSPVYQEAIELPQAQRSLAAVINLIYTQYAKQHFPSASYWGDQSIENTVQIQWLAKTFPNAIYLHVLRDGRDVVASWVKQGKPLDGAIDQWLIALDKVAYLERTLDVGQLIEVRYEDLVSDAPTTLSHLCGQIGLDFVDDMLDYWQKDTTVEHKYDAKLHGNLSKPVFNNTGRWKERLTEAQQAHTIARLQDVLVEKGYA